MTIDTPAVLYVSIDRSGLSPVPVASFHKHPGADVWYHEDVVDALREALHKADVHLCDLNMRPTEWPRPQIAAALAALPAPPGDQGEGV